MPPPAKVSDRERRLERALRLARGELVREQDAEHQLVHIIDSALRKS